MCILSSLLLQGLMNLFSGMKFFLPSDLPRRTELYRHIIAYPYCMCFLADYTNRRSCDTTFCLSICYVCIVAK